MRTIRIQSLIAVSALAIGLAAPAMTQARSVEVYVAPPAPIVEVAPAPRVGYVWAPGYWRWNGHRHIWARGHWEHERHGQHYVAHRWERRGNAWSFHDGYWARG